LNEPLTSRGFLELFRLLEPALGWRAAYTCILALAAELWAFGFVLVVLALRPSAWPLGLVGFATALQWSFFMGLLPFFLSSGFGLWILAGWLRFGEAKAPAGRHVLALMLLTVALLFQAQLHVVPTMVTGALVVAVSARGANPLRKAALTA